MSSHVMPPEVSTTSSDDELSDQDLIDVLRPILFLLWRSWDLEHAPSSVRKCINSLLTFFRENDVRSMSDLGKFDGAYLREHVGVYDQNLSRRVSSLTQYCQFVGHFGEQALLDIIANATSEEQKRARNKRKRDAERVGDESTASGTIMNSKIAVNAGIEIGMKADTFINYGRFYPTCNDIWNMSDTTLDHLILNDARKCLTVAFAEANPWEIMRQKVGQKWFPLQKVLPLLRRFPLLASLRFLVRANVSSTSMFPFHFFAWCGFESDILREVLNLYPRVLLNDKEGVLEFLVITTQQPQEHAKISLESFKSFLGVHPKPAQGRNDYDEGRLLLERLHCMGYDQDVLLFVQTFLSDTVDDFILCDAPSATYDSRWNLGPSSARAIINLLPRLRNLELDYSQQQAEWFETIVEGLADVAHPKLESIKLCVPMDGFVGDNAAQVMARRTFLSFLQNKMESSTMKDFFFRGLVVSQDPMQRALACVSCLDLIATCMSSTAAWNLESLTLKNFIMDSASLVKMFSQDHVCGLDIQPDGLSFQCPWDSMDTTSFAKGIRLGRINMYRVVLSMTCWKALWNAVSKLSKVERVMLSPGDGGNTSMTAWIDVALWSCSSLSSLTTLTLGPHTDDDTIVDITDPLVTLLKHGCLEFLQVEGSYEDADGTIGCLSYQIAAHSLCRALEGNTSLQFLFLRGVKLLGGNISKAFLSVLRDFNNTTIEFADICDDQYFYTIIPKDSWRRDVHHGFKYESYEDAWQLYYLTSSNRFGRGKAQNKETTIKEFVDLLSRVQPSVGMSGEEQRSHKQIVETADGVVEEDPASFVNKLYLLLGEDPSLWYDAVKRNIEALAHRFGLLRESPGLWCWQGVYQQPFEQTRD